MDSQVCSLCTQTARQKGFQQAAGGSRWCSRLAAAVMPAIELLHSVVLRDCTARKSNARGLSIEAPSRFQSVLAWERPGWPSTHRIIYSGATVVSQPSRSSFLCDAHALTFQAPPIRARFTLSPPPYSWQPSISPIGHKSDPFSSETRPPASALREPTAACLVPGLNGKGRELMGR